MNPFSIMPGDDDEIERRERVREGFTGWQRQKRKHPKHKVPQTV
jgi:hypothetical protein